MPPAAVHAVITAGGRVDDAFAAAIGTPWKALAPIGNRRLIDAAIDAARGAGVAEIAVVGPADVQAYCASRVDLAIPAVADGAENIRRALHAFPRAERLVFLTSDLPFIEAFGLSDFIERSFGAQLAMALAQGAAYDDAFPAAPPHFVDIGGERIANGSVFTIDVRAIPTIEAVAGRFFAARKSLLKLASLLGPELCVRFAFKRLRIRHIEARADRMLGLKALAVRHAAPGLCFDVDDIADWAYAHAFARSGR